jgi:hypothetical protein
MTNVAPAPPTTDIKPERLYYLVDFNSMMVISMTREQLDDYCRGSLWVVGGAVAIASFAGLLLVFL